LSTESERRPTILIVDDNVANLKVLLGILRDQGFDTRPATSANQALRMVAREVPDLVLLDISMPDIDGFELCRRLRENGPTAKTPVLFLSAYSGDEIAEQCRGVGGDDYVTKPLDCDEVLLRVAELLGRVGRTLSNSALRSQHATKTTDVG
jgi:CheY-like chemotaxis protein